VNEGSDDLLSVVGSVLGIAGNLMFVYVIIGCDKG
jgi:hypothetical protein